MGHPLAGNICRVCLVHAAHLVVLLPEIIPKDPPVQLLRAGICWELLEPEPQVIPRGLVCVNERSVCAQQSDALPACTWS